MPVTEDIRIWTARAREQRAREFWNSSKKYQNFCDSPPTSPTTSSTTSSPTSPRTRNLDPTKMYLYLKVDLKLTVKMEPMEVKLDEKIAPKPATKKTTTKTKTITKTTDGRTGRTWKTGKSGIRKASGWQVEPLPRFKILEPYVKKEKYAYQVELDETDTHGGSGTVGQPSNRFVTFNPCYAYTHNEEFKEWFDTKRTSKSGIKFDTGTNKNRQMPTDWKCMRADIDYVVTDGLMTGEQMNALWSSVLIIVV